ncbi:hypothetical protein B0A69_01570 [Chryseobacterium shigense]|uniref:Uncharacterized protein n=1 Tax=Chryseobacterium shigense TaxID=297244 RepID=A0A1N7IAB6_9FLAO|nr:hypothetical protein [Chryseobacterium shigense]PQA96785.1 hypothetical protein B0A69_01570 [Chryseobacterium shigense]SIS34018.1 hypothetical protein SAMN05421639_102817 [Chryseobacterium shigense]
MKKTIVIIGILAVQFISAQLYTSASVVNPTSTPASNNIGIRTQEPYSNLEIASKNGGKMTMSTGGWSVSSANPKYPTLELAEYLNNPKVRMADTEKYGYTNASKFSILFHDQW